MVAIRIERLSIPRKQKAGQTYYAATLAKHLTPTADLSGPAKYGRLRLAPTIKIT
jgi:hypothetical protein